uniref:Secreted protein n=1 Tax=Salix viminalis TaxID=40686 RepID=A0A6N2LZ31_SALVM
MILLYHWLNLLGTSMMFLSTRAERRGKNWGNRGAKLTWKVLSRGQNFLMLSMYFHPHPLSWSFVAAVNYVKQMPP